MTWDWSQNDITWDQNCWTFDGYNGCDISGGSSVLNDRLRLLRIKDDKDILDIITMLISCKILK